ncbi:hypothetical protein [Thiolinea disciformis]|uniref:hypothetical protein n=1 Tax=Thiolinea disciformis TaxID=125614 RepID=UPI000365EDB9|nr:hypothetical protein [Thiolinea disciformis]
MTTNLLKRPEDSKLQPYVVRGVAYLYGRFNTYWDAETQTLYVIHGAFHPRTPTKANPCAFFLQSLIVYLNAPPKKVVVALTERGLSALVELGIVGHK